MYRTLMHEMFVFLAVSDSSPIGFSLKLVVQVFYTNESSSSNKLFNYVFLDILVLTRNLDGQLFNDSFLSRNFFSVELTEEFFKLANLVIEMAWWNSKATSWHCNNPWRCNTIEEVINLLRCFVSEIGVLNTKWMGQISCNVLEAFSATVNVGGARWFSSVLFLCDWII